MVDEYQTKRFWREVQDYVSLQGCETTCLCAVFSGKVYQRAGDAFLYTSANGVKNRLRRFNVFFISSHFISAHKFIPSVITKEHPFMEENKRKQFSHTPFRAIEW